LVKSEVIVVGERGIPHDAQNNCSGGIRWLIISQFDRQVFLSRHIFLDVFEDDGINDYDAEARMEIRLYGLNDFDFCPIRVLG
jgi:hypothetical protein